MAFHTGKVIKTWRDPYDSGWSLTKPKEILIKPGLTVLVGCNGAGKTTLLSNIEEQLKREKVPCYSYDNLHEGGSNSVGNALLYKNISLVSYLMTASEGEQIQENFGTMLENVREFLQTGKINTKENRILNAFQSLLDSKENEDNESELIDERWLLLDSIDSGLSVDAVVSVVDVLNLILKDAKKMGVKLFIVITANEYELCRRNKCFDVNSGQYIEFKDYEDYRKFILESREKKDKRYE